ncbi:MAG: hypothetical protein WBX11_08775 [Thiobacillaceae bacterium]
MLRTQCSPMPSRNGLELAEASTSFERSKAAFPTPMQCQDFLLAARQALNEPSLAFGNALIL